MKNLSRRNFVGLALTSAGAMLVPRKASASENGGKVLFTEEMAIELADRFATTISRSNELHAISARKFFDENIKALGYVVDYVDGNSNPHGYIVFDTTDESLIAEFSFEDGASGPFYKGETAAASFIENDFLLVKTSPFTYALCGTDESAVDCFGNEMSNPLACKAMPMSVGDSKWDDIFLGDAFNDLYAIKDSM